MRDFNVAFATGDADFLVSHVTDDIEWSMVGEHRVQGIDEFSAFVHEMKSALPTEFSIETIITHGTDCAVEGTMRYPDGQAYAFCDVYRFSGASRKAKIKRITSYVIPISKSDPEASQP